MKRHPHRMDPISAALYLLVALLCIGGPGSAFAQDEETEATPTPDLTIPGLDLSSPAATLRTFFRAFPDPVQGRPDRIASVGIRTIQYPPGLSTDQRVALARELKYVLDRVRFFDYDEVRQEFEQRGPDAIIYVFATVEGPRGSFPVTLEQDGAGRWRFSSDTIDLLRQMVMAVSDRELVAGVGYSPDLSLGMRIRQSVPPSLRQVGVILEHWQWIGILLLIIAGLLLDRLTALAITAFSGPALRRFNYELDWNRRKSAARPFGLLAMAGLWAFGINWLLLPSTILGVMNVAVQFLAALSFVWAAYTAVDAAKEVMLNKSKRSASRLDDLIIPFAAKVAKIFVVAFGMVFVASNIGVNVTSLLAGLGIGGLAFALAAKNTVENVFGSMAILVDQPFRVGDWIVVEGGAVDGTVEAVGLRSTRVRTFYNSLITLPNARLINSHVDNYGARRFRRWSTKLALTYDTPAEKVEAFCEALRELVRLHPYTRKDGFHIYANEFGAHSLDILFYIFFETPDWGTELRERHRMFCDILRVARRVGVEFAFPTQTLHIARGVPGHEDKPATVDDAMRLGRRAGRRALHETFPQGVVKPPPVSYAIPDDLGSDEVLKLEAERKHGGGEQ